MFLAYVYVCFLHRHQTKLLLFLLLVVNIFVSLYQYTLVLYCTASFRINIWFVCVLNRYAFKYTSIHQSSSSQLKSQFIYFHIYYCVVLRVYIAYFCDPIAHTFYDIFSSFFFIGEYNIGTLRRNEIQMCFLVQLLLFTFFFSPLWNTIVGCPYRIILLLWLVLILILAIFYFIQSDLCDVMNEMFK